MCAPFRFSSQCPRPVSINLADLISTHTRPRVSASQTTCSRAPPWWQVYALYILAEVPTQPGFALRGSQRILRLGSHNRIPPPPRIDTGSVNREHMRAHIVRGPTHRPYAALMKMEDHHFCFLSLRTVPSQAKTRGWSVKK